VRPDNPGDLHLIKTSEAMGMYRKRVFLNPISEGAPSFIQAIADSSDEGTYVLGNYLVIIADCERRIMLHFHVSSPKARRQARAKIDKVAQVIKNFRNALIKELEAIDNAERIAASTRKTKTGKPARKTPRRS
jgi:hypothetical protein